MLLIIIMDKLIFDACSLIYLTKIEMKEMLPKLGDILIGSIVKNEATDEPEKYPDAEIIQRNLDNDIIKEIPYKVEKLPKLVNLGEGEKEAIELCKKERAILVCDDGEAIKYAISRGLKPKTSEIILLDLLKADKITIEMFNERFYKLGVIKSLKPEIVEHFIEKAKTIIEERKKEK